MITVLQFVKCPLELSLNKIHFEKVAASWIFFWEFSAISEGNTILGKLYFKVATLNRALHGYLVSLLHWFFLLSNQQGLVTIDFSTIIYLIDHLLYSSDRKLCCSPLVIESRDILEKIRTKLCETMRKEVVRQAVKMSDRR